MHYAAGLHRLDQHLCELLRAQHQLLMEQPAFAEGAAKTLPSALLRWLSEAEGRELLLNAEELEALEVGFLPMELSRSWQVPLAPYMDHRAAVAEVRHHVSQRDADRFAARCDNLRRRLAQEPVFEQAEEWVVNLIGEVRRLICAVGAIELLPRPKGAWPTPTTGPGDAAEVQRLLKTGAGSGSSTAEPQEVAGPGTLTVLDSEEVGRLLGISPKQVVRLIEAGRLPASNVGMGDQKPRYRVTYEALRWFLSENDQQKAEAPAAPSSTPSTRRRPKAPDVDYFA